MMAFKLSNLRKSILKNFPNVEINLRQIRLVEYVPFIFLIATITLTYLYGAYKLLPVVFEDYPILLNFLMILASWIFIGGLSNLFLMQIRDSSIRHCMLIQPPTNIQSLNQGFEKLIPSGHYPVQNTDNLIKLPTYYLDQDPTLIKDKDTNPLLPPPPNIIEYEPIWHNCNICQLIVPPRSWHCSTCKTCIFRRDHHCIFAMTCIGEKNLCNFLGFLFYIGFGAFLFSSLNLLHVIYFTDTVWWMFFLKIFFPFYFVFFVEFDMMNILGPTNFIGLGIMGVMILHFLKITTRGQTSGERIKYKNTQKEFNKSYANVKKMLGPYPIYRILWPWHPRRKLAFGQYPMED